MKKHLVLFVLNFIIVCQVFSQIRVEYSVDRKLVEESGVYHSKLDYPRINLPEFDFSELREKSLKASPNEPFQFGKEFDLNLSLEDGKWYDFHEGKIWKLRISSKNAFSLNLVFSRLHLSEGARMYIYNDDRDMMMGPFDHNNVHTAQGDFITDLIKGSSITIELYEPNENPVSHLIISKVIHGFVNTFSSGFGQSAPCNIDIDCPIGQPFELESYSVSRLLVANGTSFCSGALVNTTCTDLNPFLLTADHCLAGNPGAYVFRFQYRSPSPRCDGLGGGGNSFINIFYNGAQVRARNEDTDFGLLEMDTRPNHENVSFLGWTRNTQDISNTAGIHHPRGDLMKISVDEEAPNFFPGNFLGTPANTHWEVDFNFGTVERGSSGSPLLDQNRRIIGQLHGINVNPFFPFEGRCMVRDGFYGRFDISWGRDNNGDFLPGRNAANSLAPWLDPNNTNAMATNTTPLPTISGPDFLCSSSTYSIQNPPAGSTVSWSVFPAYLFSGPTSGSGTTANLSRPTGSFISGTAALTFQISTDCRTITRTNSIQVGPLTSIHGISQNDIICDNGYIYLSSEFGYLSYDWTVLGGTIVAGQGTAEVTVLVDNNPHIGYNFISFNLQVTGDCGGGTRQVSAYVNNCGGIPIELMVYPNPADEEVNLVLDPLDGGQQFDDVLFDVHLYDSWGKVLYNLTGLRKRATLDTRNLKSGFYYLHIRYKEAVIRRQIRVER
ncbi:T9SS type A sorting domain-containing protein [Belliella marina]|uniref:T9SS type A sorting domain-containing protein n=1 Tax=Belliella marina TaxID=1644146 RepID=A0ABW4VQB5_9BACT